MICIIPARGGSQRIPRKNIKMFHGKPIISYSITAARKSELFRRIVVSTDDKEIADIAQEWGAEVYMRPRALGKDDVGTQEVMRDCLKGLGHVDKYSCCLYATAPMVSALDLKRGATFVKNWGWNPRYAISAGTNPLSDAGQFYWGPTEFFLNRTPLSRPNTAAVLIPPERVCDINTPDDWRRAESMFSE